ncbi:hypothetical protein Godav_003806 [Gossypium davidsonii]|uniref:DUF4283 domain-containing protein n=1 Tax=Gossypium davidsonii TaxID=34287 RepID=A0A7J8SJQ1_GOSDV|nr:hypothetical protein [Gossypium davidsonii]
MYRILKPLWFTKELVSFMKMANGLYLVKFGAVEDRERIFNLPPWLFDQSLFAMVPFIRVGKWRGGVEILEVDKTLHEEGGRTESTAEDKKQEEEVNRDGIEQSPVQMTRMWANELKHIRVRCRLERYFFVESEGRKGGLVLLWKEMVDEEIDRFLVSVSWLDKVPFLSMEVVRQANSDHDAILLDSLGRKLREVMRDLRLRTLLKGLRVKEMRM